MCIQQNCTNTKHKQQFGSNILILKHAKRSPSKHASYTMKSGRQSDTSSPNTSGGSSGGGVGGGARAKRRANSATKAPTNRSKKTSATAKALAASGGHVQHGTAAATPPVSGQPQHQQPEYSGGSSVNNGGAAGGGAAAPAAAAHNLSPISSREKVHSGSQHRTGHSYAGFHAKSIRTIWDQHEHDVHSDVMQRLADDSTSNRSRKPPAHERREHDLDVHPDVLVRLAEDATYKMWELVNNLKTYARHSGGPVTCDLLNEVLRHSDADPILGAAPSAHHWNQLEQQTSHTGAAGTPMPATAEEITTYYFPPDRFVDFRQEYVCALLIGQSAPLQLSCHSAVDAAASADMRRLGAALCAGLQSDNASAAGAYAVHTVAINPMVGVAGVFGALLHLCERALAFEYAPGTLQRVLDLLGALARNATVRETTVNTHNVHWWHLVQLLVCAVLGPADVKGSNRNSAAATPPARWDSGASEKMEVMDTMTMDFPPGDAGRLPDDMDAIFMTDEGGVNMTALTVDAELMTIIKQEVDKQVKMEMVAEGARYQPQAMLLDGGQDVHMMAAGASDGAGEEAGQSAEDGEHSELAQSETFSALQTHRCADAQLDELLRVIGELAAHWGYVETELVYLVSRRLRTYFADWEAGVVNRKIDFDWLGRLVRLLWSLGDFAFRELTIYLALIDTDRVPAAICVYFNACAIYLRGRSDIFLYEYLYEMCGDAIMPFLSYFAQFNQKFATRRRCRWAAERRRALCIPAQCRVRRTPLIAAAAATDAACPTDAVWERESDFEPIRARPTIKIAHGGWLGWKGAVPSAVSVANGTTAAAATAATAAEAPTFGAAFTTAVRLNRVASIYRGRLIGSYSQPKYRQFSVVDYYHMVL